MTANKRYLIIHWLIIGLGIVASILTVVFGLIGSFMDAQTFLVIVLCLIFVWLVDVNLLFAHRMNIGHVFTRRCDVEGYRTLYNKLYGASKRESVKQERSYQEFCIDFYSGDFERAILTYWDVDLRQVSDQPELVAYLSYAGYMTGNECVMKYAAIEMEKCPCFAKPEKCGLVATVSRGMIDYVAAMIEGRYEDAAAALPPRAYFRSDRYFMVFTRYCFARAELLLGYENTAAELFDEVGKIGGNLIFAKLAKAQYLALRPMKECNSSDIEGKNDVDPDGATADAAADESEN